MRTGCRWHAVSCALSHGILSPATLKSLQGGDEEGGGQRSVVQRPRLELKGRMFASALGGAAAAPQLEREQVSYDDL